MTDPFIKMLAWPQSIDLGNETDWEAVRGEEEEEAEILEATEEDWREFWEEDMRRG